LTSASNSLAAIRTAIEGSLWSSPHFDRTGLS
jgi:hypothetical protein